MLLSAIIAVALAQAAASPAAGGAPAVASQQAVTASPARPDDDKVTCREEANTGSMIASRTCHTNAQWRQLSDDAQANMRAASQFNGQGGSVGH